MLIRQPAVRSVRSRRTLALAKSLVSFNSVYVNDLNVGNFTSSFLDRCYSQASRTKRTTEKGFKRITSKIFLKKDRILMREALKSLESDLDASVSIFGRTLSSDRDLAHELGKPVVHNIRLEAAVRMIADAFLLYNVIDSKLNSRRLNLQLAQDVQFQKKSKNIAMDMINNNTLEKDRFNLKGEVSKSVYKGVPMDLDPLFIDDKLLKKLSRRELDELHMYLSKYLLHRDTKNIQQLYDKYLHTYIHTPRSSMFLSDDQQQRQGFKEGPIQSRARTAHLNRLLRGALAAAGPRPERILSEAAQILMTFGALPDLETFNILIRQLTLYRMEVPARIVYEVLSVAEPRPLGKEIYNSVCRLAIGAGDRAWFLDLARVYDFNNVTTRDGQDSPLNDEFWRRFNPIRMSSYMAHEWLECREEDLKLRRRFFGTDEEDVIRNMNSTHIYTTLISGFVSFKWLWWIDGVLRKMAAEGLPIPIQVLTLNFRAAALSPDKAKVQWTWQELVDLPARLAQEPMHDIYGNVISRVFYDEEVYLAARSAASAIGDRKMLMDIESYNAQMTERRLISGHLMMEVPPDYAPFDLSGKRKKNSVVQVGKKLDGNKQPSQSFTSVITESLFAKPKVAEPTQERKVVSIRVGSRYGVVGSTYRGVRNLSAAQAGQSLAAWQRVAGVGEDTEADWVAALDQVRLRQSSASPSLKAQKNGVDYKRVEKEEEGRVLSKSKENKRDSDGALGGSQAHDNREAVFSELEPTFVVKRSGASRQWFEMW